ncbi:mutagen sensitive-26 [Diaporthe eres]|uniref:HORMA domain-containing protein n=1 Tax=Diaporthe vaccinii TaxID=105482 RepID=A0ABR4E840_9PEZI|nr:mutagen sensitive-26 [Diaporthe eres]
MSMPPPPVPGPLPHALPGEEDPLPPQTIEVPITEARTLFNSFSSFLTVSIHTILYYRSIYPKQTFLSAKAFNLPVHQSRHPKVCSWINDAVDAVMAQAAKGSVERVAVVIHAPLQPAPSKDSPDQQLAPGSVLERWMFDVSRFPAWPGGIEAMRNFRGEERGVDQLQEDEEDAEEEVGSGDDNPEDAAPDTAAAEGDQAGLVNWTDVDEQLRGAVRRLAYAGETMEALPPGCSFTVAVELRDEARAPIGHPQPWIPSQPDLQPGSRTRPRKAVGVGSTKTIPVRTVEAGPLFFECWVEEGRTKGALQGSQGLSSGSS